MKAKRQQIGRLGSAIVGVFCLLSTFPNMSGQAPARSTTRLPVLDFLHMKQPIPSTASFHDPGYYVWGGTMVRDDRGVYHLYYSRWKESAGPDGWLTYSEIAHATGASPTGTFTFRDVSLPPRGSHFWDGTTTHNPTIKRFGGKYYLYYMGNTGDRVLTKGMNWTHRNNQRIGVAVADNPKGPWRRSDKPLIDISPDRLASDSLVVTNPSLTRGRDGRYYMLYKAVGLRDPMPFGGPVVHLMAIANSPVGPFRKNYQPLLTIQGSAFPFEDPFFWFDAKRDRYFVILKDNKGIVSGLGHASLVLYESTDAKDWKPSSHLLVSDLELRWKGRATEAVSSLERPQLLFNDAGDPLLLLVAINNKTPGSLSYNVRIPLAPEVRPKTTLP